MVDTTDVSVSQIKKSLLNYIQTKPEASRWKDFYESSTGTMFIEMLSVMGSYIALQGLITRRESYFRDAKIRSSNIAIAEGLSYPVYRGKNEHIIITMTPTQTAVFNKFSVIGQYKDKDIVNAKPLSIIYDEEISFEAIIGNCKEDSMTIASGDPTNFRFSAPNVSQDFILTLDGNEIPVSTKILDLINDYYVVLTNSLESLDVFYLNRQPPSNWLPNNAYRNGQYITPDFSWRSGTSYNTTHQVIPTSSNGLYYSCIQAGITSITEPTWPTSIGDTASDGTVVWECLGGAPKRLYFKSTSVETAYSGETEPVWPMDIGKTLRDNEIIWQCLRDYTYSLYPYSPGSILSVKYIELADTVHNDSDIDLFYGNLSSTTLENSYSSPESIEDIKLNASLYHETERVIKGRNDYSKIFRQLLPNSVDTNGHDISPAVVELSYVKDHTVVLWMAKTYIESGQEIMPSRPNNFIYQAISSGYTSVDTKGLSGSTEPSWPTTIGATVIDNQIKWKCVSTESNTVWEADKLYNINTFIQPTVANGYSYTPLEFLIEPLWPMEIGAEITDNEITWRCVDTIYFKGYAASTWEIDKEVGKGDYIIPIVAKDFFYIANNPGVTGASEPEWPIVIGDTVEDNDVVWECFDLINAEKYQKNRTLEALSSYRVFGVEPPTIKDPKIVFIFLNIFLVLSQDILISTARKDIDRVLEPLNRTLYSELDVDGIEYSIERLDYIKIARVEIQGESKSAVWQSDREYRLRDVVLPTVPNGFYYESYYNRNAEDSGYSQGSDHAYSQGKEPSWPTTLGATVIGGNNHIVWECLELNAEADPWGHGKLYTVGDVVNPIVQDNFSYRVKEIVNLEPIWPTKVEESTVDGDIYWVCRDPSRNPPKCDWNEYYIIGKKVVLS